MNVHAMMQLNYWADVLLLDSVVTIVACGMSDTVTAFVGVRHAYDTMRKMECESSLYYSISMWVYVLLMIQSLASV